MALWPSADIYSSVSSVTFAGGLPMFVEARFVYCARSRYWYGFRADGRASMLQLEAGPVAWFNQVEERGVCSASHLLGGEGFHCACKAHRQYVPTLQGR